MKLDNHDRDLHPLANVCGPLTAPLGLSIAGWPTPYAQGTGGFYLAEGGDSEKVLLVTARHVLFPPNEGVNVDYDYSRITTRVPPRNVFLLGTEAFNDLLKSTKIEIGGHGIMAECYTRWIEELKELDASKDERKRLEATVRREEYQEKLEKGNKAMEALNEFHREVNTTWRHPKRRILGHVVHSPRITFGAGDEGYTEDYAVVELDSSKFEEGFRGNVIDLGKF